LLASAWRTWSQNIFYDENVSRAGDNTEAKSLKKQAFGERDCHPTVTRALQLSWVSRAAGERKNSKSMEQWLRAKAEKIRALTRTLFHDCSTLRGRGEKIQRFSLGGGTVRSAHGRAVLPYAVRDCARDELSKN